MRKVRRITQNPYEVNLPEVQNSRIVMPTLSVRNIVNIIQEVLREMQVS